MKLLAFLFAAALVSATIAPVSAAPVAPEDLFKLTFLSNAQISPDGTKVLVETSKMNGPKDKYDRAIALVDVASGSMKDRVTGKAGDGNYAWLADSKSFVFIRALPKKKPQLYRFDLATGKITQLTTIKQGVSNPVVSNDGMHIALSVTDSDEQPNAYVDFAKAGFKPTDEQKKTDIHTIDQLFFQQNGAGFTYQDHPHIWTIDVDGKNPKQLTSGQWGEGFDGWSPDDKTIAFDSLRRETVDSGVGDVWVMPASGGEPRKISSPLPGNFGMFFGADGAHFYMLTGDVKDSAALGALTSTTLDGQTQATIVPANTISWGDSLLADMKEGGGLCGGVLPNGQALLNIDGPGYANLRTLDLTTGKFADLTPAKGEAFSCSFSKDGKTIAYLYSDATHPADIWVTTVGGTPRQITHVNDEYLKLVTLSVPQEFEVKDAAGNTVQAWFMPATGGTPGLTKHPTLLNIHGGPETQFGDTFFQEFQYYASLGYNVVFSDPAGSTGHGYAFEEALEHSYGDAMFDDVQAVMNQVVTRPEVDANQLGVLGGSYGGYATFWVISHTDRYKVGVAERPVSNMMSENLAADFAGKNGLAGGYYTMGYPWDPANTLYAKFSPITYVESVHTPVLILHADEDTRAPIDQTLQEFTALKILGRTVEYVAVPNENHDLSRTGAPIHRVERLHIITNWLGGYLKP